MTEKSRRTLALPRRCVEALRQQREQQEREQQEREQQEREQQEREQQARKQLERDRLMAGELWRRAVAHASQRGLAWVLVRVLWLSAVLNPG